MTHEANKAVVRRYVEAFNQGDLSALRGLMAEDAVIHSVLGTVNKVQAIEMWEMVHKALGVVLTIEDLIAEGDQVMARYRERGVFQGAFLGKAPTGKPYELSTLEWFVIRDGKIKTRWSCRDMASMGRQVGF
jgi:steroid delta-isomerase-like uncharacterized protein